MSRKLIILAAISALHFGACSTAGKVAASPFKLGAKTVGLAGKGVLGTGKLAGKGVVGTVKAVGKSVYYIGATPVYITDQALDKTTKVLRITKLATDSAGNVVSTYQDIKAIQLDSELAKLKGASNLLEISIDALS